MKSFKPLLSLILVIVLCISIAGCGGGGDKKADVVEDTGQTFAWKIQCAYPPGDQTYDIQMPMICEAITEATDGRITFEQYIPGAICEPAQAPMSVSKGILDAAISAPNDCGQFIPAAYAEQGIPFYWENGQDVYDTFYKYGMLDFLRTEYGKKGIHYGMYVPNGAYHLMTTFPVNTAADLKGKKIRASTSYAELMTQMGAAPVVMPGGDIYMGMKLGTIDGNIFTIAELEMSKLKEVTKYVMEPAACGTAPVNLIISQKSYDALPPNLQKIVDDTMETIFMDVYNNAIELDKTAIAASKEYGVQFIEVTPENLTPFYEAGDKAAAVLSEKYPESKAGFEIIHKWKAEKDKAQ